MDRIIRQEVIFDSSALTCTVFVTHVLNVCRSKIAHIDPRALQQPKQPSIHPPLPPPIPLLLPIHGSSDAPYNYTSAVHHQQLLLSTLQSEDLNQATIPSPSSSSPWWLWQQQIVLTAYCCTSVLLLLNIDVSVFAAPPKSSCTPAAVIPLFNAPIQNQQQQQQHSSLRVSTIVLHCLFVGTLLQIPVEKDDFMVPWKIMARSFLFTIMSICWTYAVGIHEASMHMRSYPYIYNPVLQRRFVQAFTPCQLRFLALLFLDGWFLLATSLVMLVVVGRQLSNLVSSLANGNGGGGGAMPPSFSSVPSSAAASNVRMMMGSGSGSSSTPSLSAQPPSLLPSQEEQEPSFLAPEPYPADMLMYPQHHSQAALVGSSMHQHAQFPHSSLGGSSSNSHHSSSHHQHQLQASHNMAASSASAAQQQLQQPQLPHQMTTAPTAVVMQEDETVAMFRAARKAAASKMGEMI